MLSTLCYLEVHRVQAYCVHLKYLIDGLEGITSSSAVPI